MAVFTRERHKPVMRTQPREWHDWSVSNTMFDETEESSSSLGKDFAVAVALGAALYLFVHGLDILCEFLIKTGGGM